MTIMIYPKKFTLLQNSDYSLSFDTRYKIYCPCMAKHEPFQMVMSKLVLRHLGYFVNQVPTAMHRSGTGVPI